MAKLNPSFPFYIVLSCILSLSYQAEQLPDILRLRKALGVSKILTKNRMVRPVVRENTTVDVTVSVEVSDIAAIQLDGREATIRGHTCVSWVANTLTWDPANYNGLDSIALRRYEIWVPDIEVFNRVNFVNVDSKLQTLIRLSSNGTLGFCEFKTMSVSCDTDMYAFPADKHQCSILFGSSTYGIDKLNLVPFLEMTPKDYENLNKRFSEWRLRAADFRLIKGTTLDYFDYALQLDLIIERNSSQHFYRFVLPMCIGCLLTALFCWLPMDSPQRFMMPLVGLLILVFTINQYFLILSFSSTLPLFLRFATDLIFFTAFMIFLAVLAMALEDNKYIDLPSHPLLDRILRSKAVKSYILAEEALLSEDITDPESQNPVDESKTEESESVKEWSQLMTVLQRVFSSLFLSLYLWLYYWKIGSLD